jgi:hypothetical protein
MISELGTDHSCQSIAARWAPANEQRRLIARAARAGPHHARAWRGGVMQAKANPTAVLTRHEVPSALFVIEGTCHVDVQFSESRVSNRQEAGLSIPSRKSSRV